MKKSLLILGLVAAILIARAMTDSLIEGLLIIPILLMSKKRRLKPERFALFSLIAWQFLYLPVVVLGLFSVMHSVPSALTSTILGHCAAIVLVLIAPVSLMCFYIYSSLKWKYTAVTAIAVNNLILLTVHLKWPLSRS